MIATNNVSNTNAVPNVAIQGDAAPETAGFDFMNYLLGLQTAPQDLDATESTGPVDAKSLDALLKGALAKTDDEAGKPRKNELDPWSLIFPGMAPNAVPVDQSHMPVLIPVETKGQTGPTLPMGEQGIANQLNPNVSSSVDKLLAQAGFEVTPVDTKNPKIITDPKAVTIGGTKAAMAPVEMVPVANASFDQSVAPGDPNLKAIQSSNAPQGARVLHAEKLSVDTTNPVPFRGSGAELKAQGFLAPENSANITPQNTQAVAQKYAQVARGDSGSMLAVQPTAAPELALVAENGARKQESRDNAIVDPTAAGIPKSSSAHVDSAALNNGDPQLAAPQSVPHLFSRVENLAQQGGGRMTVTLSPPELGKVEVEVTTRGKRVEIKMTSDSASAKSVLESGLGDLRRQLEGQNLQLAHSEVHITKDPSQHGQFSQHFSNNQQWQQQQGGSQSSREQRGSQSGNALFGANRNPTGRVDSVSARRVVVAPGRVDVRI